jgi:hypothetical protein
MYMLPIPNQYNDGRMCLGTGNTAVLQNNDWTSVVSDVVNKLETSPWYADSLYNGSWKTAPAPMLFSWKNVDGYPQIEASQSSSSHWSEWAVISVSVGTINVAMAELQTVLANARKQGSF